MPPPPRIGRADIMNTLGQHLGDAPRDEVLGTIPDDNPLLKHGPQGASTVWTGPNGTVDLNEGPPPWELESTEYAPSDALRYVDVPSNWTLRWINPKLLDSLGWRYWQPVTVGTPGVKVKVEQMCAPDGNIRRGGATGDILAWMYTSWVESRRKQLVAATQEQTQRAVEQTVSLQEEFRRGKYGPNVHLDHIHHPTHTSASITNPTD